MISWMRPKQPNWYNVNPNWYKYAIFHIYKYVTTYGHIFVSWFRVKKSGHDLIPKSQFGFEKWTKINVQK